MLRITRKTLKRLAEESITSCSEELTEIEVIGLRRVAKTAKKISLGRWYALDRSCGCLVGTLLGYDRPKSFSPLEDVGLKFDELLCRELGLTPTLPHGVVEVGGR